MTERQGRNSETRVKERVPIDIYIPVYCELMHLKCITLLLCLVFAEARKKERREER